MLTLCCRCLGTHVCTQRYSNLDFEDSPRGASTEQHDRDHEDEKASHHILLGTTPVSIEGSRSSYELLDEAVDEYDQLIDAWATGSTIHLKRHVCVRVVPISGTVCFADGINLRRFGDCLQDFQRIREALEWDVPSGIVVLHLDRKKAIAFTSSRDCNVTEMNTAIAWARRYDALAIGTRTRASNNEFSILEITWLPGQSSRQPFFTHIFLEAVRAIGAYVQ